jgi:acetyl-CoA carboxylase biotin carboxyl carrier protein
MELTPADVTRIVEAFEASDWQHLRVSLGGSLLELSKAGPIDPAGVAASPPEANAAAGEPVTVPPEPDATAPPGPDDAAPPGPDDGAPSAGAGTAAPHGPAGLHEIVSPSAGVFWRAPSPASPPFVSEGDTVADADTVCIVEVMKLMNHVPAAVSGTVRSVLAENGQMVEGGQPLFLVERAP